jgi:hypothetical protein
LHLSQWMHTYPSIWVYMLHNQHETLMQLIESKYYSVEPTTDNSIVIQSSLEDLTIRAIFKPILIHALDTLHSLTGKNTLTYKWNKAIELNILYRRYIEWIFCSYCRIEHPIGQCHRCPVNNILNALTRSNSYSLRHNIFYHIHTPLILILNLEALYYW